MKMAAKEIWPFFVAAGKATGSRVHHHPHQRTSRRPALGYSRDSLLKANRPERRSQRSGLAAAGSDLNKTEQGQIIHQSPAQLIICVTLVSFDVMQQVMISLTSAES
jgi:hypothetical protein